MPVRIVTYSSSIDLPPTMFIRGTLLQNTQMKLSYTHIHFTGAVKPIPVCDILAVEGNMVSIDALEEMKKVYHKTILWSKDVVSTAIWFVENFDVSLDKSYVVISNSNTTIEERDISGPVSEGALLDPKIEYKKSIGEDYLDRKFNSLEEKKAIESIFSRLRLAKNQ
ncbi:hypothetical protein [Encephalitozoon cuniculi GB-M1]|uniref:Uncharacterized protein n=1 Tax=Encephalitozoon cuniculi (strain GB-M1) TaxID=284813 RepID=Q8SVH4_ENCCU|nr:uncharacterized protein ECU05_1290 [Encephalitozoon cuniculi GB-M1]CAD26649.1 hypothetical protein [Encephalitozoon cuniculi GB-M1]